MDDPYSLPPQSYPPLVVFYVTPVLMVCLEADISYHTINRSRSATLPFYFMQRARRDICHYFRATIFLVTPTARATRRYSNVPPSWIIHVAFVFVKTLTKRCLPTWRLFNLHSRRLVWDNLVFSRRRPLPFIATCCSIANAKALSLSLSLYYYRYNVILVPEFKDTLVNDARAW